MANPFEKPQLIDTEPQSLQTEDMLDEDELKDITDPEQRELLHAFGTMTLENEESMRSVFEITRRQMRAAFPNDTEAADREAVRKFKDLYFMEASRSADPLTGLYSRGGYNRRGADALKTMSERKQQAAVIRFDLSGLKGINDTYGHYAGDAYLKAVARVLEKNLPPKLLNTAARIGGDEFALFLTDTNDWEIQETLQNIATQAAGIQIHVTHPETGEEKVIRFRKPYIGIAMWSPGYDESFANLDHRADVEQVAYANLIKSQALGTGQVERSEEHIPITSEVSAEAIRKNLMISQERLDQLLGDEDPEKAPALTKTSVSEIDLLEDKSQIVLPFDEKQAA